MLRDASVNHLTDIGEERNVRVGPHWPALVLHDVHESKDSTCAAAHLTAGLDQVSGSAKVRARNLRKRVRRRLILVKLNLSARNISPALDPSTAKLAFPVEDHHCARRRFVVPWHKRHCAHPAPFT